MTDTTYTRHPLSAAFGDMPEAQFGELIDDIKRNGLISAIVTVDGAILDGWHRYRACLQAGVKPRFEPFSYVVEPAAEQAGKTMTEAEFVCSQNAHRRHLTAEQRRGIVAELLRADPTKSDRAIASMAKVDHKTVGAVRRDAERTGEIPQLPATTGMDGKTRVKPPSMPRARHFPSMVVVDGVEVPAPQATTAPPQRKTEAEDAVSPGAPAAPTAKPKPTGYVEWKSAADRERAHKTLVTGRDALTKLVRELAYSKRAEVASARKKVDAALAELDRMLEGSA